MSTEANANLESRNADNSNDAGKRDLRIRPGGVTQQDTLVVRPDPNLLRRN